MRESKEDEEQSSDLRDAHAVSEATQAVLDIFIDFMIVPDPDSDLDAHDAARETIQAAMQRLITDLTGMY